jgi:hypothetical protein
MIQVKYKGEDNTEHTSTVKEGNTLQMVLGYAESLVHHGYTYSAVLVDGIIYAEYES